MEWDDGYDFGAIEEVQVIPPGKQETFTMGCADDQCNANELPQHEVTLSPYYITKYPVTRLLWEFVMDKSEDVCYDCPIVRQNWNSIVGTEKVNGETQASMDVGGFTYYANGFIYKLNQMTGKKYRLPTEAEWEYAARGGAKGKDNNYKYSGSNNANAVAWYGEGSGSKVHSVGEKEPNELGIYDMSGNVYEWCYDWYGEDYYSISSQVDPMGPDKSFGNKRVVRGGSWRSDIDKCRVSRRDSYIDDTRFDEIGFRLVRVE